MNATLRISTVGSSTHFLKFPRSLFHFLKPSPLLPLPPLPSTNVIFLHFATENSTQPSSHQIQLHSSSTSGPDETVRKTFVGYPRVVDDSLDAELLHARATTTGFIKYQNVGNHLLSLYAKRGDFDEAVKLFDGMPDRDVRTWTILITGFTHMGLHETALELFVQMQIEGMCPNHFTLSSVLKCCANIKNLKMGKEIHGWILRNGVQLDTVSENAVVDFYVKCGCFDYARRAFEMMPERNTVSWNVMIGAYLQIGDTEKSIELFRRLPLKDVSSWNTIIIGQIRNGFNRTALDLLYQMSESGFLFNEHTFSIALNLAASLSMLELGKQIHSQLFRNGLSQKHFPRNSLIDMYCKCGVMEKAHLIFDEMQHDSKNMRSSSTMENTVSWSSIVSGYVQSGRIEEAFDFFRKMVCQGIKVDQYTLTSIASACADAGVLEQGRQVHAFIKKLGHKFDACLVSAIIDMYSKCGSLDDALLIFRQSKLRNTVIWTSLISGCALHGQGREALRLFELMLNEGIKPNEISFVGVLSGCSHAGLVEEGIKYFKSMQQDYGITPVVEHFTSMVDLLGRAGQLNEAKEFIYKNKISHFTPVWSALLAACRKHKNMEMGKWVSEKLLQLEPQDASSYVLLSNICSATERWKEAAETRSLMQKRGVKKHPGQSWIQLKNQVHTFVVGDRSHPQATEIYSYLEKLIGKLKEIGYATDMNLVMHDVEEEQREVLLGFHSEKLAIAYGIMSTPEGTPIRVMKNLRVCIDCHTAIKYISQVTGREITVRDGHRFHHFKHGQCSCGDYW